MTRLAKYAHVCNSGTNTTEVTNSFLNGFKSYSGRSTGTIYLPMVGELIAARDVPTTIIFIILTSFLYYPYINAALRPHYRSFCVMDGKD